MRVGGNVVEGERVRRLRITVAGAGSIGCYLGGVLAHAPGNARQHAQSHPMCDVTLLLRPALAEAIARHGLRVSDLDGLDATLATTAVRLATDPAAAFAEPDII